jgi:large subunit ribosomal protein L21
VIDFNRYLAYDWAKILSFAMERTMFAVIRTGSKQYRVKKGDIIDVELLEAQPGESIEFNDVLFLGNEKEAKLGEKQLGKSVVVGELIETVAGPKEIGVKYTPRQRNYRKFGHRQKYSRVKIVDIKG